MEDSAHISFPHSCISNLLYISLAAPYLQLFPGPGPGVPLPSFCHTRHMLLSASASLRYRFPVIHSTGLLPCCCKYGNAFKAKVTRSSSAGTPGRSQQRINVSVNAGIFVFGVAKNALRFGKCRGLDDTSIQSFSTIK